MLDLLCTHEHWSPLLLEMEPGSRHAYAVSLCALLRNGGLQLFAVDSSSGLSTTSPCRVSVFPASRMGGCGGWVV